VTTLASPDHHTDVIRFDLSPILALHCNANLVCTRSMVTQHWMFGNLTRGHFKVPSAPAEPSIYNGGSRRVISSPTSKEFSIGQPRTEHTNKTRFGVTPDCGLRNSTSLQGLLFRTSDWCLQVRTRVSRKNARDRADGKLTVPP